MLSGLFRRAPNAAPVERLYGEIVEASRNPVLYGAGYGVPDSIEGRFDLLVLHTILVVRRLSALPQPGPDLAQDMSNRLFAGFDAALREMGVGDLTVPKRIKAMAESYGGRTLAYGKALSGAPDAEPLTVVLARNVYGSEDAMLATPLANYIRLLHQNLEKAEFSSFEHGPLPVPDPAQIA